MSKHEKVAFMVEGDRIIALRWPSMSCWIPVENASINDKDEIERLLTKLISQYGVRVDLGVYPEEPVPMLTQREDIRKAVIKILCEYMKRMPNVGSFIRELRTDKFVPAANIVRKYNWSSRQSIAGIRSGITRELRRRLEKRGYSEKEIDEVINEIFETRWGAQGIEYKLNEKYGDLLKC